jgi:hypothetical protein
MANHSYTQPEKRAVREAVWLNAVGVLTGNRHLSPLVRPDELSDTVQYALKVLRWDGLRRAEVERELETWLSGYRASIGAKRPDELRVLYLCGPEPLNDLNEMIAHGVNPHNVWAVEGSSADFAAALAQLESSGTPLKVHRGNLSGFFDLYASPFDIIYVDACGPFLGGTPNTFNPLLSILLHARLEPLSVLITNFAEVPKEQFDRYASLMTAYFRFRYQDLPESFWKSGLDPAICEHESEDLEAFIRNNMDGFYSDFITRFIVDLARSWFPNCRALANKDVASSHHAARTRLNEGLAAAEHEPRDATSLTEWTRRAGDLLLNPSGYLILSFFRALRKSAPSDPLISQLGNLKVGGQEVHRLIAIAALLDKVIEGHWSILSDDLLSAIQLSWFDVDNHFSCDVPLPNLLVNSLLGVYGRPYFPNPRGTTRFRYTAKKTMMYTDLITFDQCRYFFEWFPTVQSAPERFRSIPFQIVARCALDRIGRADWRSSSHPFRGAAVASLDDIPAAQFYDFAARKSVESLPPM